MLILISLIIRQVRIFDSLSWPTVIQLIAAGADVRSAAFYVTCLLAVVITVKHCVTVGQYSFSVVLYLCICLEK